MATEGVYIRRGINNVNKIYFGDNLKIGGNSKINEKKYKNRETR